MADIVVDSSFAIAFMVEEEHSGFARAALRARDEASLRAPALIAWEVANAIQMKVRRGDLQPQQRNAALAIYGVLGVELEPAPDPDVLSELGAICDRRGLTIYDGAYLELALTLNADLATLDRRLAVAARAEGVKVHAPF